MGSLKYLRSEYRRERRHEPRHHKVRSGQDRRTSGLVRPEPKFTDERAHCDIERIVEAIARVMAGHDHAEATRPPRHRLTGPATIPLGAWPRRMCAAYAAAYCGELTIEAFLKKMGIEYPPPRVQDGRRQLWLRDDLDRAILPSEPVAITDIAEDL